MSTPHHNKPTGYLVRRMDQLQMLESALRLELVDIFAANGPSSVPEIAEIMGRSPESLYFHVRKLEKVGLLTARGERRFDKHKEVLYETRADVLHISTASPTPSRMEALIKITRGFLRLPPKEVEEGLRSKDRVLTGSGRNVYAGRSRAWLNEDELAELNGMLEKLGEFIGRRRQRAGRSFYAVSMSMAPAKITRSPKAAAREEREKAKS